MVFISSASRVGRYNINKNNEKNIGYKKKYMKQRIKTDVSYRLIKNTRCRIFHALNGKSKSVSTIENLGKNVNLYKKWIENQVTPEVNWTKSENDHVKPICMFDISKHGELKDVFSEQNIQPLFKRNLQQKGRKFTFLGYQLQFIKAYQFLR